MSTILWWEVTPWRSILFKAEQTLFPRFTNLGPKTEPTSHKGPITAETRRGVGRSQIILNAVPSTANITHRETLIFQKSYLQQNELVEKWVTMSFPRVSLNIFGIT